MRLTSIIATGAVTALCATTAPSAFAADTPIYMEAVAKSASLTVVATAGDMIGGYMLPGLMDGIGVRKVGANAEILINHEISPGASSVVRAAGSSIGATVSRLNLSTSALKLTAATDAIKRITWFDYSTEKYGRTPVAPLGAVATDTYGVAQHTTALNRFCSASLAQAGELQYKAGKKIYGYNGAVYFTGEEGGDESRAFALNLNGELVQLPKLGLAAWENALLVPTRNQTTAVMLNEDGSATDSQLFMYVGKKELASAKPARAWYQQAGLTNGKYYVMKIGSYAKESEFRAAVGKGKSTEVSFAEIDTTLNGKVQNQMAAMSGTALARVEDGVFDPKNPNDYYFLTTESNKDAKATAPNPATPTVKRDGGALWRLRFKDVKNPLAGASITMLLDGSEAPYLNKPDNMTMDAVGNILIQEDPGNNAHVARLVAYRVADGKVGVVAQFKDMYVNAANTTTFMTIDEESSGVTDVTSILRAGNSDTAAYFVLDAQIHAKPSVARPDIVDAAAKTKLDEIAVEGGQLYVLKITDWSAVYGA